MEPRGPKAAKAVAVFDDREAAARSADEIKRESPDTLRVRVDTRADQVESLRGEMREEVERTIFAPGNVGPFTREMTRKLVPAMIGFTALGALAGVPIAFIPMGGLQLWARMLITVLVGAAAGWTVGLVVGGGFGETDVENTSLAAERGVVVAVEGPDPRAVEHAAERMRSSGALRVDTLDVEGSPFEASSRHERPRERQRGSGRP